MGGWGVDIYEAAILAAFWDGYFWTGRPHHSYIGEETLGHMLQDEQRMVAIGCDTNNNR
jgi:hypothetical protein